jgi:hypothetical protein
VLPHIGGSVQESWRRAHGKQANQIAIALTQSRGYSPPMSTILAVSLAFALFVVAAAPLAATYWKPRARLPAALFYGALLLGVAVHHTGISFGRVSQSAAALTTPAVPVPTAGESEELTERCAEALDLAERGSIIRDRSDPQRLIVDRVLWNQMPEFVQQTLVVCLKDARPSGGSEAEIEIVEE